VAGIKIERVWHFPNENRLEVSQVPFPKTHINVKDEKSFV
jgi:hypothetical protein